MQLASQWRSVLGVLARMRKQVLAMAGTVLLGAATGALEGTRLQSRAELFLICCPQFMSPCLGAKPSGQLCVHQKHH